MKYFNLEYLKMLFNKYKVIIYILFIIILISIGFIIYMFSFKPEVNKKQELVFETTEEYIKYITKKDWNIKNQYQAREVKREVKGIDVSSWQGDIDWEKVKNSGIDFVMIRCGFRGQVDDSINIDSKFIYNIKMANKLDIPVGIYFYSTAINEREVMEEATFVLNLIKDFKVTYPVAYDFEMFNKNRTEGVSIGVINNNAKMFLDYFRAHGYDGVLYSNLYSMVNYWDIYNFEDYKIWIAHYIDRDSYENDYDMWQYSDTGYVDGIKGYVDLNIAYFAYE